MNCYCGSDQAFEACCQPLILGAKQAATPEQLMRSRYTAYALGGYGEYLMRTWVNPEAQGLTAQSLNTKDLDWQRLQVEGSGESGDQGWVRFKAYYIDHAQEHCMHEHSLFIRENNRWRYLAGKQL